MTSTAHSFPEGDDPLSWATAYASLGLRVAPIPPGAKYPRGLVSWETAATSDEATVSNWWTGLYKGHGVCVVFDQLPDGRWLFAVDVDAHDGVDGGAIWAEVVRENGGIPETVEATTGGGGTHLFFTSPREIRNGFLRGVDRAAVQVRGHGGQCVVEPSKHAETGRPYAWVDGASPFDRRVVEAPEWLLDLVAPDEPPPRPERAPAPDAGERPGDLYAVAVDWEEILVADGWTLHHVDRTGERYWTRPGKDPRLGASATTEYGGTGGLKIFTSSTAPLGLVAGETYSKIGYVAATRFEGDLSKAASYLRAEGHHADDGTEILDALAAAPPLSRDEAVAALEASKVVEEVEEVPAHDWPDPRPLPERVAPVDWPDDVLPSWVEDYARSTAAAIGTNVDLPAMLGIGALSVAMFGHVEVEWEKGHRQPTNLYLVVALPPTEGKSPALAKMVGPLREWEADRMALRVKAVAESEAELAVLSKQADKATQTAAATGDRNDLLRAQTLRVAVAEHRVPASGRMFVGDTTPEALGSLLASTGERIAVVSDEGGVLAVDRYRGKDREPNLDLWLQAFTGSPYQTQRVTREEVRLARPLIVAVVTVQPSNWEAIMGDPVLRNRGFPERIMASVPTPRAGTRNRDPRLRRHDPVAAAAYADRLIEIARDCDSWQHPAVLRVADPAMDRWVAWVNPLEGRKRLDLAGEAGWVGKMTEQAVPRLAALLHVAYGYRFDEEIGVETMDRAIRVGDYWLAHRLAATIDLDVVLAARRLLGWVLRRKDPTAPFERRDLGRMGPRHLRTIEETAEPLYLLGSFGWLRPEGEALGVVKGALPLARAALRWTVHPDAIRFAATVPRDPETRDSAVVSDRRPPRNVDATAESQPTSGTSRVSLIGTKNDLSPSLETYREGSPEGRATSATASGDEPPETVEEVDPWSLP